MTHVNEDEAKLQAISYSALSVYKTFTHHTVVMKEETVHTGQNHFLFQAVRLTTF